MLLLTGEYGSHHGPCARAASGYHSQIQHSLRFEQELGKPEHDDHLTQFHDGLQHACPEPFPKILQ